MNDPMKQLHEMTESWDSIWQRAVAAPDLSQCKGWQPFERFQDQARKKKQEAPKP